MLSELYDLEFSDDPDLLMFLPFGTQHHATLPPYVDRDAPLPGGGSRFFACLNGENSTQTQHYFPGMLTRIASIEKTPIRMIVDILNTTLTGGAAVSALRLHRGLLASGIKSRYWHKKLARKRGPQVTAPEVRAIQWPSTQSNLVAALWDGVAGMARKLQQKRAKRHAFREVNQTFFTTPWRPWATNLNHDTLKTDILHLHWLTGMCDFPSFFASLPEELPIVWTLHDQNVFTGGCHHANTCRRFESGCGHCPELGQSGEYDLSHQIFKSKKAALTGKNLHIVTPSRWNEADARKSPILAGAKSIQTIYNSLDVHEFSPIDRNLARKHLGLPLDKTIIAFGADTLKNSFKGMPQLAEALTLLENKQDIIGLAFGSDTMPEVDGTMPEIFYTGYVETAERQALIYSAADLFVNPSLAEAISQTGPEAMACGTPVVAFDVGGIPEFVIPEKTGLLAELRDEAGLAYHIQWMADHPEQRERMGRQARQHVVSMFEAGQQTQKHMDFYQQLYEDAKATQRTAA
jgi:glycosyltransferase involved in cell wall biosynthesis